MNADTFEWQDYAVCARTDPDLWHTSPQDGGRYTVAKDYCHACPVLTECAASVLSREWGLPATERRGVWGGMTAAERVRAEHARRAVAA